MALNDYSNPQLRRTLPSPDMPLPPGPANFPIKHGQGGGGGGGSDQTLQYILQQLIAQYTPTTPYIRAASIGTVAANGNATLDWTAIGSMNRIAIRNIGPGNVWLSFDVAGPAVPAYTSDGSWQLQPNESLNLANVKFRQIGISGYGVVHAVAFQSPAGKQGGSAV
jgi:hypothetical protein